MPKPKRPQQFKILAGLIKKRKPKGRRDLFLYILLAVISFLFVWSLFGPASPPEERPISEVFSLIQQEEVGAIDIDRNILRVELKDGSKFISKKESGDSFLEVLTNAGVDPAKVSSGITVKEGVPWGDLLINFLPVVLLVLFLVFMFRQARGGAADMFSFGKSRARLFSPDQPRVSFKDAGGVAEAKQELEEVVDFLKHSAKYRALGARVPKGVLLVGPAGTGKTLLARAVAGEAGVAFFSVAGSEFMEMLVGVGASRVRDLFRIAKLNAPSIIFVDELESIGRQRGIGFTGGHEEREQTLNQILVEMDGFTPSDNVIVLAATNRPDLLDRALTRPGRFDRTITLDLPDIEGRKKILEIHMRGKPFTESVDVDKLAKRTVGFSGADIENMLNEAAILAARRNKKLIDMGDLEESATKVKLGPEKRRLQSDEEKRITAYHEAGHAIVASSLPNMDPVHRISIVSRGHALGFTEIPPQVDRYHQTKTQLLEQISALLGGRGAEELEFNEFTVGAGNDIEKASIIARKMVTEFGMSSLGPIALRESEEDWLSRQLGESSAVSEKLAAKVDDEIAKIIDECYKRAKVILKEKKQKLDIVARKLVEQETIEEEEFKQLIKD